MATKQTPPLLVKKHERKNLLILFPSQSNLYVYHMKLAHSYMRMYKYARHLCDLYVAQRQALIFIHAHICKCQFHVVNIYILLTGGRFHQDCTCIYLYYRDKFNISRVKKSLI